MSRRQSQAQNSSGNEPQSASIQLVASGTGPEQTADQEFTYFKTNLPLR
ncbi:hypothetical protein [Rhodopirellula europaea]|uniref:Uncharacterized protein n=1 Tax=Rhodopirellula europaea SH398 TaxID=1263868 RepID=M5SL80_9BACT|nr:hypothetical protein [Rhodopirellula europaea]EMI26984.1 hypothetical protein RESH_02415 [Rhodopirellula europaea SH398]